MVTNFEALTILTYVFMFSVTYFVYNQWLRQKMVQSVLPPGPMSVPILGHLHHLFRQDLLKLLSKWADQFGEITTVNFGPLHTAVVISDVKVMREVFSIYPASTGKHNTDPFLIHFGGHYGIVPTEGHQWSEQRQFCLRYLRELGYGKSDKQGAIIEHEVTQAIDWIREESKKHAISPFHEFQKATLNSLWTIITGSTFASDDNEFSDLINNYFGCLERAANTGLAFAPWIKHLSHSWSGYADLLKHGTKVHRFVNTCFHKHEATSTEGKVNDLIDTYLKRIKSETNGNSTFYGEEGVKHCLATVIGLYIAGGETTSSTLTWLLGYLIAYPDKQFKLQDEVDRIIGRNGGVTSKDRARMPYTEAVILETFRISSLVPLGVMHKFTEDTPYKKYLFPKDTLLIANLYHVHHNQQIWGDPEEFRPERFLEKNGNINLKDYVVPFQVGKRACLAEGLARDLIFTFTVKVVQAFKISSGVDDPKEYLKSRPGFMRPPPRLPMNFTSRD